MPAAWLFYWLVKLIIGDLIFYVPTYIYIYILGENVSNIIHSPEKDLASLVKNGWSRYFKLYIAEQFSSWFYFVKIIRFNFFGL